MFKLDLEKQRNQRSNCQHPLDHQKNESSRITSSSASLTMIKSLTLWSTTNWGKLLKKWGYRNTLSCSWQICMQVKKQQNLLEPDMEQTWNLTWNKHGTNWFQIGKGVCQGCIFNSVYLTYIQSILHEMPGLMKHKLESRFLREMSVTSDMQMTPPL